MCGIVGYLGSRDATPILIDGLTRLEYRGYDSAGVAVQNGSGITLRKLAGRIDGLRRLLEQHPVGGSCGIAHTRWATHGAPTECNAHPHIDCSGQIALVHNGIIENADVLRARLELAGHRFVTETDTETLAHLLEDAPPAALEIRVISALADVEGTYGLAVVSTDEPDKIVVARRGSPVLLGIGEGEFFVASDASALLEHTRSVVYLADGDIAVLTRDGYRILDRQARVQARPVDDIDWDLEQLALGEYSHFMLKEICEQPRTVQQTLRGHLVFAEGTARLNGLNLTPTDCAKIRRIVIVACGTSWHAGLAGRHIIEELAGIPVQVEYASEFRYRRPVAVRGALTIAISQSGETADTLEALRAARRAGARVVGVVNVVGSTIAREAEGGIYLHAGPEVGVASTKAFTSQIVALLLLGLYLARQRGMSLEDGRRMVEQLARLPDLVARTLELDPQVKALAQSYAEERNTLYLGRGINFPVALEGALKLKEI
ncbi:MAG: glutamine--fructose-6-phosphate transaminase (isomerizing) [Gemmatimonadetes bacterium]|nr:glutamine--fructose-6-phosphate transaminase (isomerizing) [Gemmatimonadota bacterium]